MLIKLPCDNIHYCAMLMKHCEINFYIACFYFALSLLILSSLIFKVNCLPHTVYEHNELEFDTCILQSALGATCSKASSLSTVLIVGIGGKLYGFWKISRFKNQPCNRLYKKTSWNALVRL